MITVGRERWKPVPGYEGLYEVSDLGRVRSAPRQTTRGGMMRLSNGSGHKHFRYKVVALSKDGRIRQHRVHCLVLEAFIGPCPKGYVARHFPDRDPTNNRLTNLQWGTAKQNQADRIVHGTDCKGVKNPNARLKEQDVREIRELFARTPNMTGIANRFGVDRGTIYHIVRRKTWTHI